MDLSMLGAELGSAAVLSLFVLIGNPLIVMAIMGWMGYRKRTGFLAGLTVAQISEFSIIFVAMGITLGHVGVTTLGLTTLVGLITITLSTYMILYSQHLYERLSPWLGIFERQNPLREQAIETQDQGTARVDVIVIGLGRYGRRLLTQLREAGIEVLGVDFDPEVVSSLREAGLSVRFGDGEDPAFLESLPLAEARWVVSSLPAWDSNRALLDALKSTGFTGQVAAVARDAEHHQKLERAGVKRVLNPFDDAADEAARSLRQDIQTQETNP
jgi:hypothetical protein